ncbi:hypothetical protein TNCV_2036111 [Trichonephila clavipes]|nr:hypothetical protein TNCV_2036111 [Trichonephila clavipes]
MATGSSMTQNHSRSQSEIQGDLHNFPASGPGFEHRAGQGRLSLSSFSGSINEYQSTKLAKELNTWGFVSD